MNLDATLHGVDLFGEPCRPAGQDGVLREKFGVPPFSVLNARDGYWQDRKRAWLGIGLASQRGRGGEIHKGTTIDSKGGEVWEGGVSAWQNEGTSIFDPVLCELAYNWFCPPGGTVLDPFAGGSVRGIVASMMGLKYHGVDLRPEQVEANREQAATICDDYHQTPPAWHIGDSAAIGGICMDLRADFVFSCPPYGDLEVYSDSPCDISNMSYPDFLGAYREIIKQTAFLLKPNRFACFVVGDFRDKAGNYRSFPAATIKAFEDAGLPLYNEAILVTAVGSLPVRIGRQWEAGRKLGKTHQNILVFVKGDGRQAARACNG